MPAAHRLVVAWFALLGVCSLQASLPAQQGSNPLPPGVSLGKPLITLAGGIATLDVPPGMRFLDAAATAAIREGQWGNAHDDTVQGMVVRDNFDPSAKDLWAVIVHWQPTGYLPEAEWTGVTTDSLLEAWRAHASLHNATLALGQSPVEILACVDPPRFDTERHTAHWAKRYRVGDEELIAYESRAFGRAGVFVLKATGKQDQLAELAATSEMVLSRLHLTAPHRYQDFTSGDKSSTLATAGLIAMSVWDQLPTFQKVMLGILAAAGLLAVLRWITKLFGR